MLVLTRRVEESVVALIQPFAGTAPLRMILKVLEIDHAQVKLGFTAPREDVTLLREEIESRGRTVRA